MCTVLDVLPARYSNCVIGLVRRLRALTYTLLPMEVPPDSISDPTSRIITPQVIQTFIEAAGDLVEVVRLVSFAEGAN